MATNKVACAFTYSYVYKPIMLKTTASGRKEGIMIDTAIATLAFMGYCIFGVIGIIGMLVYMYKKERNYLLIATIILGTIGCIFAIPTYMSAITITGLVKYIIGITFGITVAFTPLLILDYVVIKLHNMYKKYARHR